MVGGITGTIVAVYQMSPRQTTTYHVARETAESALMGARNATDVKGCGAVLPAINEDRPSASYSFFLLS